MSIPHPINLVTIILFVILSKQTLQQPQSLKLGQIKTVNLLANNHTIYTLKLTEDIKQSYNLFISAQSPFNDPFEQPYMNIKSDNNFQMDCDDQADSYTGICKIDNKELRKDREFQVQVYCIVDCMVKIAGYLSQMYVLDIGKTIQVSSMQDYGLAQIIKIPIPESLQFTSIIILSKLLTLQNTTQGITLLANYGPNATAPTQSQYKIKAQPTFGHSLSIEIPSASIKGGQDIILYLFLGINNTVQLSTIVEKNNSFIVGVGMPVVGFTSQGEKKVYVMDLSAEKDKSRMEGKDVFVKVVVYSGSPDIKLSYDQNFTSNSTLSNVYVQSSFAYIITPELRTQKNFSNFLYLRISSYFLSSFQIELTINNRNFILLQTQTMQLCRILPDALQNFIYEDETLISQLEKEDDGVVRYKATVQMIQGGVQLGIRDCDSLMKDDNVEGCVIKTVADLKNPDMRKTFQNVQGTMKKYFNTYQILFSYNVTTCPMVSKNTPQSRYICSFHIILHNIIKLTPKQAYLGIQVIKYSQHKILKQGQLVRDSVPEEVYNYYSFQVLDVENVVKLEVFTTVFQGDLSLLLSDKIRYPQYQDVKDDQVKMSVGGRIVLEGEKLKKGVYYVSVYGYEMTDYVIGIAYQRTKKTPNITNQTDTTLIRLQRSTTQTFTLQSNKTSSALFLLPQSSTPSLTTLKITQLQGTISYTILQKQQLQNKDPKIICSSYDIQLKSKQSCTFNASSNVQYVVKVNGQLNQTQVFTIGVKIVEDNGESGCSMYPINIPMYLKVDLSQGYKGECYQYELYEIEDLEVTVAMSDLDKVKAKGMVLVTLIFSADKNLTLTSYQQIIQKQQLQPLCTSTQDPNSTISPSKLPSKCRFSLQISSNNTYNKNISIQLMIAVQTFSNENVLFDGIPQKVITNKLNKTSGKHFYYYVYDVKDVRDLNIFLTSETQTKYMVAARVVSDAVFSKDLKGDQYPKGDGTDEFSIISNQFSVITNLIVPKDKIQKIASSAITNVILISIFGLSAQNSNYIFKVEASMKTTSLAFGQSKLGYVDQDEIYQYQVQLDGSSSVIEVRSLGQEKCMLTYIVSREFVKDGTADLGRYVSVTRQFQQIKPFNNQTGTIKILLKGTSPTLCTYQISLNSLQTPLRTILKGTPYKLTLQPSTPTAYYLYKSTTNKSLLFIQMINSGNSIIYAKHFQQSNGDNIQQEMQKNLDMFTFKGELNANLLVDGWEGYWIVVVKAKDRVDGEFIVNVGDQDIPLKEGSIMRDKLPLNTINTYFYYSLTNFNLTINPIYGRLDVTITFPPTTANPNPKTITRSNISTLTQIKIQVPSQISDKNSGYYDPTARFIVNVTAIKDSSYYIGVKKIDEIKLFQGVPVSLGVGGEKVVVSWTNYDKDTPITILVEDLNYPNNRMTILTFNCTKTNLPSITDTNTNPILSSQKSQSSYNIQIYSQKADYTLSILSTNPTNISIILVKTTMTHLLASRTIMMNKPSIFQIFSPGDSVMIQIFSCVGDIVVVASSNYTRIVGEGGEGGDEGVVRMEHANYGGHYVISSQSLKGEYYIKTQSLSPTPLTYIITYYLYTSIEHMPYKLYSLASPYINYTYTPNSIQFSQSRIYRKDNEIGHGILTYTLYISNNSQDISKMTRCSIGNVYKVQIVENDTDVSGRDRGGAVVFKLDDVDIKAAVGTSNYYYVGGEAAFTWPAQKPHHTRAVYFVYQTSQMVTGNQPQFKQSKKSDNVTFVLLWIVVPFCIGSFVFYLAVKYFINSIRQGPNQLIEEDGAQYGQSQEVFGNVSGKVQPNGQVNQIKPSTADANIDKYSIE